MEGIAVKQMSPWVVKTVSITFCTQLFALTRATARLANEVGTNEASADFKTQGQSLNEQKTREMRVRTE